MKMWNEGKERFNRLILWAENYFEELQLSLSSLIILNWFQHKSFLVDLKRGCQMTLYRMDDDWPALTVPCPMLHGPRPEPGHHPHCPRQQPPTARLRSPAASASSRVSRILHRWSPCYAVLCLSLDCLCIVVTPWLRCQQHSQIKLARLQTAALNRCDSS